MWTRFRVKSSGVTLKESPEQPLLLCSHSPSRQGSHGNVCSSWALPVARALHMVPEDLWSWLSALWAWFGCAQPHCHCPALALLLTQLFLELYYDLYQGSHPIFFLPFFFNGWGVGRGRSWSWEHKTPSCSHSSVSLSRACGISFECRLWACPSVLSCYWGTY